MSTLTVLIVIVFCIGYFCIAIESVTKINKAAIALLMFVATWTLFMFDPGSYVSEAVGSNIASAVSQVIEHHLGSTATTLFFLMGAMTIVELVDQNGGFNFVRDALSTTSKRRLLWRIAILTFFRQPDHVYRDDYDPSKTCQRQEGPSHLRCLGSDCCQFGWCFLSNWRRDHHHALEQGCHHCSRCHLGNLHSLFGVDAPSCLYSLVVVEG